MMQTTPLNRRTTGVQEPMGDVLRRTSVELLRAAELIENAQAAVSRATGTSRLSEADIQAYQGLDRAVQSIAAVSDFILALNRQVADDVSVSPAVAAEAVVLSDVARRLMGVAPLPPADDEDVTLFL